MINTISNRQMFFILLLTLTSYSVVVISKDMAQSAGTGSWLIILITALVFSFAVAVIASLNNRYKGQMFFDYAPSIIGKPITYIIALFYIVYFMSILVFLVASTAGLMNSNFLLRTPSWSLAALSILLFCFVTYKGVTCVARLAEFVGIVYIITAVTIHFLMITEGNIDWMRPFFNVGEIEKYIESFKYSVFPFLGIEVLLVFPFATRVKKPVRASFISVAVIGLFYVLIVESCLMKLGIHHILHHKDALIIAIRDTAPKMLEFLARLDIFYLTVGIGGLFIGTCAAMLAEIEFLCRVLKRVNRIIIVIAVGIITFVTFLFLKGIREYEMFMQLWGTVFGLIAAIALPLILLIIDKIKNRKKKESTDAD